MTRLKKQKQDLENRLREQEEELDDLAGQVYSHGDCGDGDGGEGGDGDDEDLDNHFVQFLLSIDGLKLSLTCNLEVPKNYYVQVQQLEAGKVKLEADLNQVRKIISTWWIFSLSHFLIFSPEKVLDPIRSSYAYIGA